VAEADVIADPERLPVRTGCPIDGSSRRSLQCRVRREALRLTQTQREPIVQPDGALDYLGREAVTATDDLVHQSASCQGPRPGKLLNLTNPLDEPSLGLAPRIVDSIFDALRQINSTGVTVLVAEQHVAKALEVAETAYVIESGRIVGSSWISARATHMPASEKRRARALPMPPPAPVSNTTLSFTSVLAIDVSFPSSCSRPALGPGGMDAPASERNPQRSAEAMITSTVPDRNARLKLREIAPLGERR
jgi:hypothetical protein